MPILFRCISRAFWPGLPALTLLAALPTPAQAGPPPTNVLEVGFGAFPDSLAPGTATVSGGGTVATGNYAFTYGTGPATTTYREVDVARFGTLNLKAGGAITGLLSNQGSGISNIYGGSVQQIQSLDSSVVNIYGGTVSSAQAIGTYNDATPGGGNINLYGGSVGDLVAESIDPGGQPAGTIDIFGTNLAETYVGTSVGQSVFGSVPLQDYTVTGTLQDGTALNATYESSTNGTLLFNGLPAVPEASTTVSFGLLLALGLGGLIVSRKKRLAA